MPTPDPRPAFPAVSITIEPERRIADTGALRAELDAAGRHLIGAPGGNGPLFSVGCPDGRQQVITWETNAARATLQANADRLEDALRRIARVHGGELTLVEFGGWFAETPHSLIAAARRSVKDAIGRTRDRAALDGHRGKLFGEAFAQYADWALLTTALLRLRLLQSVEREARLAAQREAA